MTLIELLFFLLPVFLSAMFWRFIFRDMGPWGAVPASFVGFGVWALACVLLNRKLRNNKPTGRSGHTTK